jgi:WD40 repeat protein
MISNTNYVLGQSIIDDIVDIAISPDGSKVAVSRGSSLGCLTGPEINRVSILDSASLETIITFTDLPCPHRIVWSHDSSRIVSTGSDGLVRIWDVTSGAEIASGNAIAFGGTASLSWRADDSQIAGITFRSSFFAVYDPANGTRSDIGVEPPLPLSSLQWHPTDSNIIASGSVDGGVQIRSSDGQLISAFQVTTKPIIFLNWSPDASMLFFLSGNSVNIGQEIIVMDASTGVIITQIDIPSEQYGLVANIKWSSNSRLIASVGTEGYVSLWNAFTGNLVDQIVDSSQYMQAVDIRELDTNQYELIYGGARLDLNIAQLNTYTFSERSSPLK